MLRLSDSPSVIPGVGRVILSKLRQLHIYTIRDLLFYFPFRYDRFSTLPFVELSDGDLTSVVGTLRSIENIYTRTGKCVTRALFDSRGSLVPVIWFHQPYLVQSLKVGDILQLHGRVGQFAGMSCLLSPGRRRVSLASEHDGFAHSQYDSFVLFGVYSEIAGLPSHKIRALVQYAWEQLDGTIPEYIPASVLADRGLDSVHACVGFMHFPSSLEDVARARARFAFEEIFVSQLRMLHLRSQWSSHRVSFQLHYETMSSALAEARSHLPFLLTGAQDRVLSEILRDLSGAIPMNRLLQGDVGSGKTVVAALVMYGVYAHGYRSIFMAPTHVLAVQHYNTIHRLLSPFGVRVSLVVSGKKIDPYADIFVGTHALLYLKEQFDRVAFTLIDEQHRFGVAQRARLRFMHGVTHVLTMTATPIPRTLALTLYGDLDLSVLDEMPLGRKKVKTRVVPPAKREQAEAWIRAFIRQKREQVFVVCPFVAPSESVHTVASALREYDRLRRHVFGEFSIGLLHGKMSSFEKQRILEDFQDRKYDILVCSPVVEVGIDIPNASVIVIESAERFGLAQLHQLRGRVGRGGQQGFCFLFSSSDATQAVDRLRSLETIDSGIVLAELDLTLRGFGEMYGHAQHGQEAFRFADLSDLSFISDVRHSAEQFLLSHPTLDQYPLLCSLVFRHVDRVDSN